MNHKQKLELTWIGKDKQPQLEPRILIEDAGKSYLPAPSLRERGRAGGDKEADRARIGAAGNMRIYANKQGFPRFIAESLMFQRKTLAVLIRILYIFINTRAVPLVRKDDAHQGRVFYFRKACSCEGGTL